MEQKNTKKHLLIALPTYLVVIAAIVLLCLFIPKACQKKTECKLDVACTNSTVDGQTELHNFYPENDVVTLTFKANDLYSLPSDIKVTSGNQQLVKDTDYTYSDQTGVFSFNIHGDTNVAIEGFESLDITFTINLPANNETEPAFTYDPNIYPHESDYPGTVDWGDGTVDNKMYHRYSSSSEDKTYKVVIKNFTYDYFSFEAMSGYSSNHYLSSINLTHTIKTLGYESFSSSLLSHITIPNSVKKIGDMCFYHCRNLSSVDFESDSQLTSIGEMAFYNCESLTSIIIPSSVTSIVNYTFGYCTSLTSITVEEGNTVYDSRENCNAIIRKSDNTLIIGCKDTTIPNTVTSIGDYAFYGCNSLTSINIPSSVTSIGDSAFSDCSSLTSIDIPNSVTSIGDYAFYGCNSLHYNEKDNANYLGNDSNNYHALIKAKDTSITSCTIDSNCKVIVGIAFYDCDSLTSINIPSSVTSIGDSAFSDCSSLTSIDIPNSVTSIGDYAFYNINANAVVDMSSVDHLIPITNDVFAIRSSYWDIKFEGIIKVKSSLLETYKTADYWKNTADCFVGV